MRNPNSSLNAAGEAVIKAIIFDMDGTLYKSQTIHKKFAEAAYHTLAREKSISLEQAQQRIEQKRESMKDKYGKSVPYTLTLRAFGIPIEVWHEHNIAYFNPGDYLRRDPVLRDTLKYLKQTFALAVLTNNNHTQTVRTLKALGVYELFDGIFTYTSYQMLKPDPAFFLRAAADLNIEVPACCYIGDRYDVDLKPAKAVGMHILEVQGPEDIYNLPHHFCKEAI